MIKIGHLIEIHTINNLPKEVVENITGILTILDASYGQDRNEDDDGGYILIIESIVDFKAIIEELYLDLEEDAIPEFVDLIKCDNGEVYTSSLILCNNDYGISIVMPLEITPDNLKEYIVE